MIQHPADSKLWRPFHLDEVAQGKADCILIGIPYDSGAGTAKGQSHAPSRIRQLIHKLPSVTRTGYRIDQLLIADLGDVAVCPTNDQMNHEQIYAAVSKVLCHSQLPLLSLGGDHSVTFPAVKAAAEQAPSGLIWFDAHPDALDSYMNSRYSHGSPLRRIIEETKINPENVLLVGTRFYEGDEYDFILRQGAHEIPMSRIEEDASVYSGYSEIVANIASRVKQFYVSIDIDVLDPAFAPGTGSPVPGGLALRQLFKFLELLAVPIRAYDIVEYCPPADQNDVTARLILILISEILRKISLKAELTKEWRNVIHD